MSYWYDLYIMPEKDEELSKIQPPPIKRPAEGSPDGVCKKRSALENITNAIDKVIGDSKKVLNRFPRKNKPRETLKSEIKEDISVLSKSSVPCSSPDDEIIFNTLNLDLSGKKEDSVVCEFSPVQINLKSGEKDFEDFDATLNGDPLQVPEFSNDIFCYYKEREKKFVIGKYIDRQTEITRCMRSILIDWMVEVQESFELNHETLYLAVKIVDRFLDRIDVPKEMLQLVGTTAMFIAAKYDERIPPSIEDFLYICDDAYNKESLLELERDVLHALKFELGIPLSYCFLRRFARCSKTCMETLTLARYILEYSLMDYEFLGVLDSHLAAAALLLALKMKKENSWTRTLQHYTGYKELDLKDMLFRFNNMLKAPLNRSLMSIHKKYSHPVFYKVTEISPLDSTDPFFSKS